MKKYILSSFLLISWFCDAQFAPFPTPGLEYGSIYNCNMYDCPDYFSTSMRYVGDTTACGETWHRFLYLPYLNNPIYLKVDQGKYYLSYNCVNQYLLYDFSKNVGDTVETADLGPVRVISAGSFTLADGAPRKSLTVQKSTPFGTQTYTWVDGVGDIKNSFFRNSDFEGGHERLVCLRDSSGVLFNTPDIPLNCDSLLCPQPQPAFDYSCSGKTFHFKNISRESDAYTWDFGDGETSAAENPAHTFTAPGCYEVILKATTGCLPQEYSISRRITVDDSLFWKKAPHQPPAYFTKMQFLDAQKAWAISAKTIWKTSDGGMHWDSVPYPGPLRTVVDLHFKDFEHGIVQVTPLNSSVYGEILWTDDGVSWSIDSIDNYLSITAIERTNDSTAIVAAHYQGVFVTKDRGKTWINIALPGAISLITDFVHIGGDTVYFAGTQQLILPYGFGLGKTTDLFNWQVIPNPNIVYVTQMSFIDARKGWLSNGGGIFQTLDGGNTWNLQTLTPVYVSDLEFADSLHGWACGHHTGIYGTSDGGQTWRQQICPRTEENIAPLATVSAGQAYVFTQDGLFEYSAVPQVASLCGTSGANPVPESQTDLFSVRPNPASETLLAEWQHDDRPASLEWVLYNAQGQSVLRWPAAQEEPVSVAHLPAGFYFLRPVAAGYAGMRAGKVVISR